MLPWLKNMNMAVCVCVYSECIRVRLAVFQCSSCKGKSVRNPCFQKPSLVMRDIHTVKPGAHTGLPFALPTYLSSLLITSSKLKTDRWISDFLVVEFWDFSGTEQNMPIYMTWMFPAKNLTGLTLPELVTFGPRMAHFCSYHYHLFFFPLSSSCLTEKQWDEWPITVPIVSTGLFRLLMLCTKAYGPSSSVTTSC